MFRLGKNKMITNVHGFINVSNLNWNDLYIPVTSRMSPCIDIFLLVTRRSKSQNITVIDEILKETRTTFKEDTKAEAVADVEAEEYGDAEEKYDDEKEEEEDWECESQYWKQILLNV